MNSAAQSGQNEPSAAEHMMQLSIGYVPAMCLNVAARLGVADHLTDGLKGIEEIARSVGANQDVLYRVMRALSTVGVFQETDGRRFGQTPASDLLRSDHPQTLRPFVVFFPDPLHFRCYANLMHSVKTGETTAGPTVGKPIFEYFRDDPESSEIFNAAMVNMSQMFIPAVLEAYDFGDIRKLVDVGGGHGSVLAAILQKYPQMKGVLFDLDHVIRGAGPYLQAAGVADRCETLAGDFFHSVPPGGDAYILKHIIHDWDDEKSLIILKNIRAALHNRPHGRVLLLEFVLSAGNEPHMGKWADIEMLAMPGGRERTEVEYRDLFYRAGFRLERIVPTKSPQSVIEAVPR